MIALPSAIPTQIVVGPVAVVLTIGQISLRIVSDQIVETEPVMGGHIVDCLIGVIRIVAIVGKEVAAAVNPAHQIAYLAGVALDEGAHVAAKSAVPLAP